LSDRLDSSRAHADLGWSPQLNLQQALDLLVEWYRAWQTGSNMHTFTLNQIEHFRSHCKKIMGVVRSAFTLPTIDRARFIKSPDGLSG
jgi:hypothetical protein